MCHRWAIFLWSQANSSLEWEIKEAHEHFNPINKNLFKVKAHETRAVATTLAFKKNISLENIIQAANWRTRSVLATTYLKIFQLSKSLSTRPYYCGGCLN